MFWVPPVQGERAAIVAGLYAGICFGVFWIPIRALEATGFSGPWAMVIFAGLPLIACLPVLWWRNLRILSHRPFELLGGLIGGLAFALYATAFLYTDVVRVIVMFYVMPVWGFLMAWAVLGERITLARWIALVLCFAGLFTVFGQQTGVPWPENLGDWCALLSGILWALAALLILMNNRVPIMVHGFNFFASATVVCLVVAALATVQGHLPQPRWAGLGDVLIWVVPVSLLLILPAGLATVFAPTRLNPGVAGLLFMAEVVVAAITVAIWADETLGVREVTGLILIMSAGLVEPLMMTLRKGRTA